MFYVYALAAVAMAAQLRLQYVGEHLYVEASGTVAFCYGGIEVAVVAVDGIRKGELRQQLSP